ncbi:MAG TPA: PAS domain S-box protein [Bacteroidota bacterium]|nr:PAS domain S-box protein [Bacteroidota bacterium]
MKKIPRFALRMRLLLLLLISILPGLVLTLFELAKERQRANAEAQDLAYRMANIISVQQQDLILSVKHFLFTLTQIPDIRHVKNREASRLLNHLLANGSSYSDIGVADAEGNILASALPSADLVNVADRGYFQAAIKTGDFAVGEFQIGRITHKPSINFAYPIAKEDGKVVGVVFTAVSLEQLGDLESQVGTQLLEGWTVREIDRNGILLAQYPRGQATTGHHVAALVPILKQLTVDRATVRVTDSDGKTHLYAHSQIVSRFFPPAIDVVLDIPGDYAIGEVNHIFYRNLALLSSFALLTLLAGAVTNEFYLVRALTAVRTAAIQLAGGELRSRVEPVQGLIEVKELGITFNEMAGMIERREIERQRAEESLHASEERYHALFTYLPDGLYVHVDGRVTLVNPALCKLLGAEDPSQLVGKRCLDIVDPEFRERARERLNLVLRGDPTPTVEERLIRLDGGPVDVEVNSAALDWQGSRGVQIIVRDITERKRVEKTLKDTVDQLHALSAEIESVREEERKSTAREVHDELGQILTAIRMEVELVDDARGMDRRIFDERIRTLYELSDRGIDSVQKISARLRPGVLDDLGLLAAIEWQVEEFQKHSNIHCTLSIPKEEPDIDDDRSTALFRILGELLTNVGRHAQAHNVAVSVADTSEELMLSVMDDGIGMSSIEMHESKSFGIQGIRERLFPFGGTCVIQGEGAGGTVVTVHLPKMKPLTADRYA